MRSLCFAGALVLASSALAGDPEIKFEKFSLPNGMTVILSEDHRLPQVAVNMWYHVGAANQTTGRSGFAHLFEHMMFSGSKHVQPSPFKVLESVGTMAGSMANGTTNFDRTNYFEVVPTSELKTALWVESDRMAFLLDTLDQKKLEVQRNVVSNERRQTYENRPYGLTFLKTCSLVFPAPHPYSECVIGSIPEIQAASVDDLKYFFKQYYGPNNASLAVVGDFDPAVAKAAIEQYFGPIPAGPKVARPEWAQPVLPGVVKETVRDNVAEVGRLDLVWAGVKHFTDEEAAGDVLALVLGDGHASRLYKALVVDSQVAATVSASNSTLGLGGYVQISAVPKDGKTPADQLAAIQAVIDDVKKNGPTAAEVERVKRKVIASSVRSLELIGGFGGKADILNRYETFVGDPGYLTQELVRYRAVTPEAVKAFANKYLLDDRRIELTTVPVAKTTASAK